MHRVGRIAMLGGVLLLLASVTSSAPAAAPGAVHFTAVGAYGMSANTNGVLNAIDAAAPDLNLALGDLSNTATGQEQTFCDYVTGRVGPGFPFELVSGEMESDGHNGDIAEFSACLPNQLPGAVGTYGSQYYVDVPQGNPLVRYVVISPDLPLEDGTTSKYDAGTARYNWTSAAIDGARSADIPWVVVAMNKPCLSLGESACGPGTALTNLLLSKRVDLVLTGHEHLYQRTKQLALGNGCTSLTVGSYNAACVEDASDTMSAGGGTVFATVGTGGVELGEVNVHDPEAPYFATSMGSNHNPTFGFLDVTADADSLSAHFERGTGGTFTDAFTLAKGARGPNQPPTGAFSTSLNGLSASFDGHKSSDDDGTIASYAWTFGDSTSGTGISPSHTYAAAGSYEVTLTTTDDDGDQDSVTRRLAVTEGPTNAPPVAAFRSSTKGLTAAFSGRDSTDVDGDISTYAWTFGDGTSGTGVSPSHPYPSAGSYNATLRVTDDEGGTDQVTHQVIVTAPPGPVSVASDDFDRTSTTGWGTALAGGAWTTSAGSAAGVSGGRGSLTMSSAGSGPTAWLDSVASTDLDLKVELRLDKVPTGGSGVIESIVPRRIVGTGHYLAKVQIAPDGVVRLGLSRETSSGTEVSIVTPGTVRGLTYRSGTTLTVRVQATGTAPTTLRAKVWAAGSREPAGWRVTATDATAAMQAAGGIGLQSYLSGSATNSPVSSRFDNLVAVLAGTS